MHALLSRIRSDYYDHFRLLPLALSLKTEIDQREGWRSLTRGTANPQSVVGRDQTYYG